MEALISAGVAAIPWIGHFIAYIAKNFRGHFCTNFAGKLKMLTSSWVIINKRMEDPAYRAAASKQMERIERISDITKKVLWKIEHYKTEKQTLKENLPHMKGLRQLCKRTCNALYTEIANATTGLLYNQFNVTMKYDASIHEHLQMIEENKCNNKDCLTCSQYALLITAKERGLRTKEMGKTTHVDAVQMKTSESLQEERAFQRAGHDVRARVESTKKLPYSAIGLLVMTFDNGTYIGTGAVVGRNIILTAAHNLYFHEISSEPRIIRFLPGENDGDSFFEPTIARFHIPEEYKTSKKEDYAIIVLNEPLGDYTGSLEMIPVPPQQLHGKEVSVGGYPSDKIIDKISQWVGKGEIKSVDSDFITYWIDTGQGQSGSPVFFQEDNKYKVVGVHVLGDELERANKATLLTNARIEWINTHSQSQNECAKVDKWWRENESTRATQEFWGILAALPWRKIARGAFKVAQIAVKELTTETAMPTEAKQDEMARVGERRSQSGAHISAVMPIDGEDVKDAHFTPGGDAEIPAQPGACVASTPKFSELKKLYPPNQEFKCQCCQKQVKVKQFEMETSNGNPKCPLCGYDFCDMSNFVPSPPPIQIFQTMQGNLFAMLGELAKLKWTFTSSKLIVLAAVGMVGTGKSTWLNAVSYVLGMELNKNAGFTTSSDAATQTRGIWCLPYPLHFQGIPDIEVLLLDLEGTGGLDPDKKDLNAEIRKIYLAGCLLCSVLTAHSHQRVDAELVKNFELALLTCERIKEKIGVDIPKLYICLKDVDKLVLKERECSEAECVEFIAKSLTRHTQKPLESYGIKIMCKSAPPTEFLKDNEYSVLPGTKYITRIANFLEEIQQDIKKKPGEPDLMDIESFIELCTVIQGAINNSQFEMYFVNSIDGVLSEELKPIIEQLLFEYEAELTVFAKEAALDISSEQFEKSSDERKNKYRDRFTAELKARSTRNPAKSEIMKKLIQQFNNVSPGYYKAKNIFELRKTEKARADDNEAEMKRQEEKMAELTKKEQFATIQQQQNNEQIEFFKREAERVRAEDAARTEKLTSALVKISRQNARMPVCIIS
jgi:V8-like Glu-specific endopeptidase